MRSGRDRNKEGNGLDLVRGFAAKGEGEKDTRERERDEKKDGIVE